MRRSRGPRTAAVLVAVLVSLGYGGLDPHPDPAAATTRGVVLGHVPRSDVPVSASIVIGKGAATKGYATKVVTISQDGQLSVVNLDTIDHTVTTVAVDANGDPLLDVLVPPGSTISVPAASELAAGTYDFYCRFHPNMQGQLIVEGTSGGVTPTPPTFEQPLVVPRVLRSDHVRLTMRRTRERMLPHGRRTPLWTYGGSWPGPTIRRPAGHDTSVTFVNDLPRSAGATTVHLHGDHHRTRDDGQPDRFLVRRGHERVYDFPLTYAGRPEPSSFFFYHDHRMDRTARNNWRGLQGMFIVDDERNQDLRLPRGRHDVPLLIGDRSFTKRNRLTDPFKDGPHMVMSPDGAMTFTGPKAPPNDATVGTHILANGRYAPYLRVSATRYRLRLLNASSFSAYNFALSDGRPFVQVGTGDGLLPRPVVRQNILLGPAQRADVIVDFHRESGDKVALWSIPRTDGATTGTGSRTAAIMQFRVTKKATDHSRLPARMTAPRPIKAPPRVTKTWRFGLKGDAESGTFWSINGRAFDPDRVDLKVPLGSTQRWRLRNVSPVTHYVHIHAEQWHTVTRDGRRPPPWERGLEDTWRLDPGESVTVAARFRDYTGAFMIHCHMLDHEDHGMMARFVVTDPGRGPGSTGPPAGPGHDHGAGTSGRMSMAGHTGPPPTGSARESSQPTDVSRFVARSGSALGVELLLGLLVLGSARLLRRRPVRPQQ